MRLSSKRLIILSVLMLFIVGIYAQTGSKTQNRSSYSIVDSLKSDDNDSPLVPGIIGQTKTFYLKDGNVFNGVIKAISKDGDVTLISDEGTFVLPYNEILEETVVIMKKDGTNLQGKLLGESDLYVLVGNKYGKFKVSKTQIEKMERYFGGQAESKLSKKKFFAGEEQLTALFLDPTAFVLQPYTFYITGLSMGYGFSEKLQLFTKIPNNFKGDINLTPRLVVYQDNEGASRENVALHASLYSNHNMNAEYARFYDEDTFKTNQGIMIKDAEDILKELYGENKKFFWETGIVYSKRNPLKSGRGNWSYHAGLSINQLLFEKPIVKSTDPLITHDLTGGFSNSQFKAYRAFFGIDYDLTRRIKFISEIFYDEGNRYLSFDESVKQYFENGFVISNTEGKRKNVDFDFGITFAPNDTLRLGLHFQQPFITIYWKFLDY